MPSKNIYVYQDSSFSDSLLKSIHKYYNNSLKHLSILTCFHINKDLTSHQYEIIKKNILSNEFNQGLDQLTDNDYDWKITVKYLPNVNNNLTNTAKSSIEDYLNEKFGVSDSLNTSTIYLIKGQLSLTEVEKIIKQFIVNETIETFQISPKEKNSFQYISLNLSNDELEKLSSDKHLALDLNEMLTIRSYFENQKIQKMRKRHNLDSNPTDVELEAIAQTWSEHCKHKIFNAEITLIENNKKTTIDSLFKTYIKSVTDQLANKIDWLVSVFNDNAGIISFDKQYNVAFKVETHNSPSALDPYGGALTGILGVNRDILGVGMGARVIVNTDIFCFAPFNYHKKLPDKILHPRRIFEGVVKGIEHGGNKSGIPTVNGSILFDENYLGKPLVYCGSVGIIPKKIHDKCSENKKINVNDLIVIAGGRTGKDGIHGATFSSEEYNEKSPLSAVQIGDPFTQKKLSDFVIDARDKQLFNAITDNGAGGFSSSIGEMALFSNGCEIHLDKAKLKADNVKPYEILISESQERMTLAVGKQNLSRLIEVANFHEVEISVIGEFTDTGNFHVFHKNKTVALLELQFLHFKNPQLKLVAEWQEPAMHPISYKKDIDYLEELTKVLSALNTCSKEKIVRRYDHEVQAQTIIKPFTHLSGPSDASVIIPLETFPDQKSAISISHGICPKFANSPYDMAANAVDEALRNCLCVGTDFDHIAVLDNFCWPDPIYHPQKTPDGKEKLGALVKANQALFDTCIAYELPIISGKDSMKNDYKFNGVTISIPYTLLISAIGKISDYKKSISMEFKKPGDNVYVLGITEAELGMSEWAYTNKVKEGVIPKVNTAIAKRYYKKLSKSIRSAHIASCHDISDGGLAAALAETCFSSPYGVEVSLQHLDLKLNEIEMLFSESSSRFVLSVSKENTAHFEKVMEGEPLYKIGTVTSTPSFIIKDKDRRNIIQTDAKKLKDIWQSTLNDID